MFQVKICGVTQAEQAAAIAEAGADAVGLNFYSGSKRYVAPGDAKEIVAELPESVAIIGVFVDPTLDDLRAVLSVVRLTHLQLHGDEPPEFLSAIRGDGRLNSVEVIKAFRIQGTDFSPINDFLSGRHPISAWPDAVLVDAFAPAEHGGTGKTLDWKALQNAFGRSSWPDLILAGGLNPDNVSEAIEAVHPAAVDTASGVEDSPGEKNIDLVKEFVSKARDAFEALHAAQVEEVEED